MLCLHRFYRSDPVTFTHCCSWCVGALGDSNGLESYTPNPHVCSQFSACPNIWCLRGTRVVRMVTESEENLQRRGVNDDQEYFKKAVPIQTLNFLCRQLKAEQEKKMVFIFNLRI